MGSSHLLNKGLPLGKRLPFLLHGATRESVVRISADIWAFVRLSYSVLASPPPLPFLLPSSLLRFSLFPIIFHLNHSSTHNCLLSVFSFPCEDSIHPRARAMDLWWLALLTALIFPSLKDKKNTHYPLWKILRGWQGHDSLSYGPPSHCAVEMWLPVPASTYFLISVSSKEILLLEESESRNT